MVWINRIFFILLLNSISGGFAYIIWKIISLVLEKYGMISTTYRLLKIVIVFFFLPVTYIFLRLRSIYDVTYMWLMPQMDFHIKIGYVAWFIGMVVFAVLYAIRYGKFIRMSVYTTKLIDKRIIGLFHEVCDAEGVSDRMRGRIKLMENPAYPTACASGVLFPKIVLSDDTKEMKDGDLKIILAHELYHLCHHDLLVKQLAFLVLLLNCWNPAAYALVYSVNNWSECDCDRHVIFKWLDGSLKTYYSMMVACFVNQNILVSLNVALFNHRKSIKRRIKRMEKYKAGRKLAGAVMALVLVIGSSMSVFAASEIAADVCEREYAPSGVERNFVNETSVEAQDDLEIYTMTAEEMEELLKEEGGSIIEDNSRTNKFFDWTIPGVTIKATSAFWCSSSSIKVTAEISPKYAWVGIIDPDGTFEYVKGTGTVSKTFPISQKGAYKVFVKNINATEIDAIGYYIY